jgi:hypothetical protein
MKTENLQEFEKFFGWELSLRGISNNYQVLREPLQLLLTMSQDNFKALRSILRESLKNSVEGKVSQPATVHESA